MSKYIKEHKVKKILEIGTAIGYSAINMAKVDENIKITTIERNEKMYAEARKNIRNFGLEKRITLVLKDALEVNATGKYDLIFIDAAKAQYIKFFEKFKSNLSKNGGYYY